MINQEFFILQIFFRADADKLTFLQAIKIINYRMKNKNSDNLKPEEVNIDKIK